jgi:hypothetical protein
MNKKRSRHFRVLLSLLAVTIIASLLLFTDTHTILAQSPDGQTQGSQINYATSAAWVTSYNDAGAYTDVAYVPFGQDVGYNTELSGLISHVADTTYNSYVLNWRPNDIGKGLRLCGMRVAYRLPLEGGGFSSSFSYVHVAGSVLRPRDSSSEYSTDNSGGCIYLAAGSTYYVFNTHLNIPNGSRIDYLRVFYYREGRTYLPIIRR